MHSFTRMSGNIFLEKSAQKLFTDPQGKMAHRSLQILKESSTWEASKKSDEVKFCFGSLCNNYLHQTHNNFIPK